METSYLQGHFGQDEALCAATAARWNKHQPWGEATYAPELDGDVWRIRVSFRVGGAA